MLYIHGMGHFHPENVIDNAFLEALDIGTDNQWIVERVGIHRRRTVLDLNYIQTSKNMDPSKAAEHACYTSAQTAAKAAQQALTRAGLTVGDIGMVIAGGCAPDYALPANACLVANELGINAPAIDVNSACSSFAAHMHFVNSMHSEALPDYVLLIQAENWTKTIDYQDRSTAVLIGDGTAAAIVSKRKPSAVMVKETHLVSDPTGWVKVQTPTAGHFKQEGPAVQKFAIKKTMGMFQWLQKKINVPLHEHYFIGHQANLTMLKSVTAKLGIQPSKHLYNVDEYGNCAAAGAPTVLSQHWQAFKAGDYITVVVVGAGLTWGGMVIEVGDST